MNSKRVARDIRGVSPVIATILMVAITVVLAAVLYVIVTQIIVTPEEQPPNVVFGSAESYGEYGNYSIDISSVSEDADLEKFEIILLRDNIEVDRVEPITRADGSGSIELIDFDGEGTLSSGDRLLVNTDGVEGDWELRLYWISSNKLIATATW